MAKTKQYQCSNCGAILTDYDQLLWALTCCAHADYRAVEKEEAK